MVIESYRTRTGGDDGSKDVLNGCEAVDDGYSRRDGEDEVAVLGGDVLLHVGEGELGDCSVDLFEAHLLDRSGGGHDEGEQLEALLEAFGYAGDAVAGRVGGDVDLVKLFGELSVAEEEAQRGAEVVEFFGRDALGLGVAGCVEPGELAVQDEDLSGGLGVAPLHAAGLAEEEGAFLVAVHPHAGVVLAVVGTEAGEVVVVVVDLAEDGGVLGEEGRAEGEEKQEDGRPQEGTRRICESYATRQKGIPQGLKPILL